MKRYLFLLLVPIVAVAQFGVNRTLDFDIWEGDLLSGTTTIPNIGKFKVYGKDSNLYFLNSDGAELEVGALNATSTVTETLFTEHINVTSSIVSQGDFSAVNGSFSAGIQAATSTFTNLSPNMFVATNSGGELVSTSTPIGTGGGGGGGLDVFYTENFEDYSIASVSSGNDATYKNGGTLQGALALETSSPLAQDKSLKFTSAAASANDWVEIASINLDLKQRAQWVGATMYVANDNDSGDVRFVVWDNTNDRELTDSLDVFDNADTPTRHSFSFYTSTSTESISVGFQVVTGTNSASISFDDLELTTNPFAYKDLIEVKEEYYRADTAGGMGSTNTRIPYYTNVRQDTTGELVTVSNSSTHGLSFTVNEDCIITMAVAGQTSSSQAGISANSTQLTTDVASISAEHRIAYNSDGSSNTHESAAAVYKASAGDVIRPHFASASIMDATRWHVTFSATKVLETEHVVTPAKSNLSDWTDYTPSSSQGFGTISSALQYRKVGDSIQIRGTFTSGTNNTSEKRLALPDGFTSSTNLGSVELAGLIVGRNTSAVVYHALIEPNVTYMTFGVQGGGAAGLTKITSTMFGSGTVVAIDATIPVQELSSDATFLAAVPVQKTAILKDVKASGSAGGTFTSGAWQTRDLNTVEGDFEIVSLDSNQFTLQKGKYVIEASAMAWVVNAHQTRLVSDPNGAPVLVATGTNEIANTVDSTGNRSFLKAVIEITEATTYELQHRCDVTRSTDGFGASASFGDTVYTQVEITKIK